MTGCEDLDARGRMHSMYARLGASRWSYARQQELQERGSRGELMRAWDDILITRRSVSEDEWTVDRAGEVLDKAGVWHHEPLPSSRSDAFLQLTRHTLVEAIELCRRHGYWGEV